MVKNNEMILIADNVRGIYALPHAARSVLKQGFKSHDIDLFKYAAQGPEEALEVADELERSELEASDGSIWHIYQAEGGDVFLMPEGYENDEQ